MPTHLRAVAVGDPKDMANVHLITLSQNLQTRAITKDHTTGHKGISYDSVRNSYKASLTVDKRRIFLGRHKTLEAAIEARAEAEETWYKYKDIKNTGSEDLPT